MKRILPFATASAGYPPLNNNATGPAGWDHIQLAIQENDASILKFLTQDDATRVYILTGTLTIAGGNYSYTGGFVYYQGDAGNSDGITIGEIFYCPKVALTSMGGHAYLNAAVSMNPSAADPIVYIGGGSNSPHAYRTITLTPAGAASVGAYALPAGSQAASLPYSLITTLPDATLWQPLNQALVRIVGGAGNLGFNGAQGWSVCNSLAYWIDAFGLCHIQGDITGTAGQGTNMLNGALPANMIPKHTVFGFGRDSGVFKPVYVDGSGRLFADFSIPYTGQLYINIHWSPLV